MLWRFLVVCTFILVAKTSSCVLPWSPTQENCEPLTVVGCASFSKQIFSASLSKLDSVGCTSSCSNFATLGYGKCNSVVQLGVCSTVTTVINATTNSTVNFYDELCHCTREGLVDVCEECADGFLAPSNGTCTRCQICTSSQYLVTPCGVTQSQCADCTVCSSVQYEVQRCTLSTDRQCADITCPPLTVDHARLSFSRNSSNGAYPLNTVADIVCDPGYTLSWNLQPTCISAGSIGTWSYIPTCTCTVACADSQITSSGNSIETYYCLDENTRPAKSLKVSEDRTFFFSVSWNSCESTNFNFVLTRTTSTNSTPATFIIPAWKSRDFSDPDITPSNIGLGDFVKYCLSTDIIPTSSVCSNWTHFWKGTIQGNAPKGTVVCADNFASDERICTIAGVSGYNLQLMVNDKNFTESWHMDATFTDGISLIATEIFPIPVNNDEIVNVDWVHPYKFVVNFNIQQNSCPISGAQIYLASDNQTLDISDATGAAQVILNTSVSLISPADLVITPIASTHPDSGISSPHISASASVSITSPVVLGTQTVEVTGTVPLYVRLQGGPELVSLNVGGMSIHLANTCNNSVVSGTVSYDWTRFDLAVSSYNLSVNTSDLSAINTTVITNTSALVDYMDRYYNGVLIDMRGGPLFLTLYYRTALRATTSVLGLDNFGYSGSTCTNFSDTCDNSTIKGDITSFPTSVRIGNTYKLHIGFTEIYYDYHFIPLDLNIEIEDSVSAGIDGIPIKNTYTPSAAGLVYLFTPKFPNLDCPYTRTITISAYRKQKFGSSDYNSKLQNAFNSTSRNGFDNSVNSNSEYFKFPTPPVEVTYTLNFVILGHKIVSSSPPVLSRKYRIPVVILRDPPGSNSFATLPQSIVNFGLSLFGNSPVGDSTYNNTPFGVSVEYNGSTNVPTFGRTSEVVHVGSFLGNDIFAVAENSVTWRFVINVSTPISTSTDPGTSGSYSDIIVGGDVSFYVRKADYLDFDTSTCSFIVTTRKTIKPAFMENIFVKTRNEIVNLITNLNSTTTTISSTISPTTTSESSLISWVNLLSLVDSIKSNSASRAGASTSREAMFVASSYAGLFSLFFDESIKPTVQGAFDTLLNLFQTVAPSILLNANVSEVYSDISNLTFSHAGNVSALAIEPFFTNYLKFVNSFGNLSKNVSQHNIVDNYHAENKTTLISNVKLAPTRAVLLVADDTEFPSNFSSETSREDFYGNFKFQPNHIASSSSSSNVSSLIRTPLFQGPSGLSLEFPVPIETKFTISDPDTGDIVDFVILEDVYYSGPVFQPSLTASISSCPGEEVGLWQDDFILVPKTNPSLVLTTGVSFESTWNVSVQLLNTANLPRSIGFYVGTSTGFSSDTRTDPTIIPFSRILVNGNSTNSQGYVQITLQPFETTTIEISGDPVVGVENFSVTVQAFSTCEASMNTLPRDFSSAKLVLSSTYLTSCQYVYLPTEEKHVVTSGNSFSFNMELETKFATLPANSVVVSWTRPGSLSLRNFPSATNTSIPGISNTSISGTLPTINVQSDSVPVTWDLTGISDGLYLLSATTSCSSRTYTTLTSMPVIIARNSFQVVDYFPTKTMFMNNTLITAVFSSPVGTASDLSQITMTAGGTGIPISVKIYRNSIIIIPSSSSWASIWGSTVTISLNGIVHDGGVSAQAFSWSFEAGASIGCKLVICYNTTSKITCQTTSDSTSPEISSYYDCSNAQLISTPPPAPIPVTVPWWGWLILVVGILVLSGVIALAVIYKRQSDEEGETEEDEFESEDNNNEEEDEDDDD